jgi:hypothetical protein
MKIAPVYHALKAETWMAIMLFRSKREEQTDCRYRYSCNRPHRLLVSKTSVVSNTDHIGQK